MSRPARALALYATDDYPMSISNVPNLFACPLMHVLDFMKLVEKEPAESAHTGSAVGRALELWHSGIPLVEADRIVTQEAPASFPLADLAEARVWAQKYAADPRNNGLNYEVLKNSLERRVRFKVEIEGEDPIVFVGKIDQVRRRRANGAISVWDVKSGKSEGTNLLNMYVTQIALYTVGVAVVDGVQAEPGGIIRLRGYTASLMEEVPGGEKTKTGKPKRTRNEYAPGTEPVFFQTPCTYDDCLDIVDEVCQRILEVRHGSVAMSPGNHCGYCPASSPANCLRKRRKIVED